MAMDKHSAFLSTDVCAVKLPVPPLAFLIASRQNVVFVPLQKQIAALCFSTACYEKQRREGI